MKQLKISLAVVINILTAITFGYFCFLGANFHTLGDKSKSIIIATIITLLLIGTSLGAKLLKQTTRNFKSRLIWEIVLLVLFSLLIASFTYYPFSHYFVVSAQKNTIQTELNDNITQAEKMYLDYENHVNKRNSVYLKKLKDAVSQKGFAPKAFKDYGFDDTSGVTPEKQIQFKQTTLNALLLPPSFKLIKTNDSIWLANAKISVKNWEPISLVDVINNIQTNTTKSLDRLITLSENEAQKESAPPFNINRATPKNVKNYFTTLGPPSPFSIVLAILGYLLMLLSWYITKRDSRVKGALTTAEYEVVL